MPVSNLVSAGAWLLGRLLPVKKNKVVISHFYGRGFGDSPGAIAKALLEADSTLDIRWLLTSPDQVLPDGIRPVSYRPLSRIIELSTARVWIDDCRKGARFKKKNQIYLQTWHGFALKRIEADAVGALDPGYEAYARRDGEQTDVMISGSRFMTELYRSSFWYDGPVEEFGSPRNDMLFQPAAPLRQKVCKALGIPPEKKLVLYAPTFRVDGSLTPYSLDVSAVLDSCNRRFGGDHVLLLRLHPNIERKADSLPCDGKTIFQATHYPDMQELLSAADVVISDYSSLMFDFALTGRPVFQFATDIDTYRQDRSFNFPLDQLPFSLAEDNEALQRVIAAYDPAKAAAQWARFSQEHGIHEDGHAAQRCAQWILARIK